MPLNFYLIRHGETDWNKEGRIQGQTDTALNDCGIEQAQKLKKLLADCPFTHAFSSELARAYETANIVLEERNIEVIAHKALLERTFGKWEGTIGRDLTAWTKAQIKHDPLSQKEYLNMNWNGEIESIAQVYQRLIHFIKDTIICHISPPATILLSSHAGVLSSVISHLEPYKPGYRWIIDNCGWLHLKLNAEGQLQIVEKNGVTLKKR